MQSSSGLMTAPYLELRVEYFDKASHSISKCKYEILSGWKEVHAGTYCEGWKIT